MTDQALSACRSRVQRARLGAHHPTQHQTRPIPTARRASCFSRRPV